MKKILIVEDNDLNLKLFRDLLSAHGYDTHETKEGLEAFGLVKSLQPDLILMDIQLPEISGLDITRQIIHKLRVVGKHSQNRRSDRNTIQPVPIGKLSCERHLHNHSSVPAALFDGLGGLHGGGGDLDAGYDIAVIIHRDGADLGGEAKML